MEGDIRTPSRHARTSTQKLATRPQPSSIAAESELQTVFLFPAVAAVMIVGAGTYLLLKPTSEQQPSIGETTNSPIEPNTIALPTIPEAVRLPSDPLTASNPIEAETKIVKGDTLSAVLKRMGVSNEEAALSIKALRKVYDPRSLRKGDKVTLSLSSDASTVADGRLFRTADCRRL